MADELSIQFSRFSAFYTPLIATIAGGFLKEEGFAPKHSNAPPGKSAIEGLLNGTVHVCQSAPSQGFGPLEKGQKPPAVHFAQINEMDGFFLTGRAADPAFTWDKLRGTRVLVDHGGQPLAMFKYACHRRGLPYGAIVAVDVPSAAMDAAFRKGDGDYIHQQGPAPQQLEHDGAGHIVASVGQAIGPCACATATPMRSTCPRSTCGVAKCWRSSAPTAAANPRCSACWGSSRRRRKGRSASKGAPCARRMPWPSAGAWRRCSSSRCSRE